MGMFNTPKNVEDPSVEEITPALRREIADTCTTSPIVSYTGIGNCYHAVGHAIAALVNENIAAAVGLCDSIFSEHGLGARYYCATGVYMQRDIVWGEDDVKKTNLDVYPCDTASYPAACYRYKLHRLFSLPDQYEKAAQFCLSLKGVQQQGCFHGLGFAGYAMVKNDPANLNVLCGFGDALDKQMCVEGVLPYLNVADKKIAALACITYAPDGHDMCIKASLLSNFDMQRDFVLYSE